MSLSPVSIRRLRFEAMSFAQVDEQYLFKDVTFDFPPNRILWIQASNGFGKSALLKLIGALHVPTAGHYFLNQIDVKEMSFEEFRPYRLKIGYSFEMGGLISNRTVEQNLMLPFSYHRTVSAEKAEQKISEFCELFGLSGVRDLRPSMISGGLRKAACVARSLITSPELLIMDNPTAGLNEKAKRTLVGAIKSSYEQGTLKQVFIVSEDESFVREFDHDIVDISKQNLFLKKPNGKAA